MYREPDRTAVCAICGKSGLEPTSRQPVTFGSGFCCLPCWERHRKLESSLEDSRLRASGGPLIPALSLLLGLPTLFSPFTALFRVAVVLGVSVDAPSRALQLVPLLGIGMAVAGLTLGIMTLKKRQQRSRGLAVASLVVNSIGLVTNVVVLAACTYFRNVEGLPIPH